MRAGGNQTCLLVRTRRSLAAEEGWELSISSRDSPQLPPVPAKAPALPWQGGCSWTSPSPWMEG